MSRIRASANMTRLLDCVKLALELPGAPGPNPLAIRDQPAAPSAWEINFTGLFETPEQVRTIGFLGLVELAASSGYVDLAAWEGTPALIAAAGSFGESLGSARLDEPRLLGVRRLLARLNDPHAARPPLDQRAYANFESYLGLTRSVFDDPAAVEALIFTHSQWKPGADAAALLSPRHFAEALATDHVGAVRMRGFSGVPRCLEAIEWLVSLLERVRDRTDLHDVMLANARWSHAVWMLRERADEWAVAMSEWSAARDFEGEARWVEFRKRVFRPLDAAQRTLALDRSENVSVSPGLEDDPQVAWSIEVPPASIDARVAEMLAAGRDEAARRTLRVCARRLSARIDSGAPAYGITEVERLVALASRLAELGDADSAAAFVAPYLSMLQRSYAGGAVAAAALQLIAQSRRDELTQAHAADAPAERRRARTITRQAEEAEPVSRREAT